MAVNVYHLTSDCTQYSYRDQVTRSALSIASNIAEGYERDTLKDCVRFLYVAKGSCGECWTQLLIGAEAALVDKEQARPLIAEATEISRMLRALIIGLQKKQVDGTP
jgi:four helix bundle protein